MTLDDKLEGWDAGLLALISQLEAYKAAHHARTPDLTRDGWDDAISAARKLIGDARTQKGLLANARGVHNTDEAPQ